MRRELKLVLLVFCLVVGPAVVLSFLAGRILGNWQVILQKRMEVAAAKTLDDVARNWQAKLDSARRELLVGLKTRSPVVVSSAYSASNAWFAGVFVFTKDQGLVYPAGADTNTASSGRDDAAVPARATVAQGGRILFSATNAAAAIREYCQILEQPDLEDDQACRVRLRLAQAYRKVGQFDEARACIEQAIKVAEDTPWRATSERESDKRSVAAPRAGHPVVRALRDPDDGFYYDLIALKALSELCEDSGDSAGAEEADQEVWRRVLDRYDDMAPFQRQLATVQIDKRLEESRKGGRPFGRDSGLLAQWLERKRGHALERDLRVRLEQEFGRLVQSGQLSGEGWTVARIGTNEYWVALASQAPGQPQERRVGLSSGSPAGNQLYAVQIDHERLMAAISQSASAVGANAGLAVEVMRTKDPEIDPRPLVSERRLASPLDRVTLAAYPADSLAFLANVRLQSRLYGWGGFVLIISVVMGAWLIWREAANEIRAARERSDFAAAVSHDLRTPLSSMRMLAESLYLGRIEDETKRKRFLQIILKESDRLSRLTDRALYFIQFGQGALRYRMTEGDLGGLVKDVVDTFATGIEGEVREAGSGEDRPQTTDDRRQTEMNVGGGEGEQKWRISLRVSEDLPAVRFDAGAMEQVVFNLLDNAVKYSRDRRRIEVSIGEDPLRGHIRIAVKDYGSGIDPADLKRIFKAHQRGGSSMNTAGLGLGLALCRDVVKAHRGTIEVDSLLGCGSTFTVILPAV